MLTARCVGTVCCVSYDSVLRCRFQVIINNRVKKMLGKSSPLRKQKTLQSLQVVHQELRQPICAKLQELQSQGAQARPSH
jgi:hypothetical protein